jgi:hypothetical protein
MRRSLLVTAFVAAAAAAAPAPAAAQEGGRLETGCKRERVRPPARRRPADAARDTLEKTLTDSLRQALLRRGREAGIESPAGIVAVEIHDRRSGGARASTFASQLPAELAQQVVDAAAADVARWPGREDYFTVRLDPSDRPEPAVGQVAVECQPVPLNASVIRAAFLDFLHRENLTDRGRFRMTVRFLVSRDGEVTFARATGGTASTAQKAHLTNLIRMYRFRPASINGTPVDVWVEQPFQMRTQTSTNPGFP